MRPALAFALLAGMAGCAPATEETRFNWDMVGRDFCEAALAEDIGRVRPRISPELAVLLDQADGRVPARLLLQGYDAPASGCSVRTRNAALVEIRRDVAGGPGWVDTLVMVPEADGSTRIDDILFGTRPSDTLRARLGVLLGR